MNNISILDCTLRDGGYINNWDFGKNKINGIIKNLANANIDIVECGFLRDVAYNENSSVFPNSNHIKKYLKYRKKQEMFVAMIECGNFKKKLIKEKTDNSIDGIRLTFHLKELDRALEIGKYIKAKGYKLFFQPVGNSTFTDEDFFKIIKEVNKLKPYAFYLVDTLGVMYQDDTERLFNLIDSKLNKRIKIGLHSHNNLQMSFANAQYLANLNTKREIIIDTSVYGMGRGVGNLPTELLADYYNKNSEINKYNIIPLLNIADSYLMSIYAEQRWGYDIPYFVSAVAKCHPNYASYLINKGTLNAEKITSILNLIPANNRDIYDEKLISELYLMIQNSKIDDSKEVTILSKKIKNKTVLLIGPGSSIVKEMRLIEKYANQKNIVVISVNFVLKNISQEYAFISNQKRYSVLEVEDIKKNNLLVTSNINDNSNANNLIFNYSSLLGEGNELDNSGAMAIRLLKKCGVKQLILAGFDGFDININENYAVSDYKNSFEIEVLQQKNNDISKQLASALEGIDYKVITKTKYSI